MRVQLKTLAKLTFSAEVAEDATVLDVKKVIEQEHDYQLEGLKLIFKGKVLADDDASLQSAGVTESDFLVMVGRKKGMPAVKKAATTTTASEPAAAPAPQPDAPTTAVVAATSPSPPPASPTPAPEGQPADADGYADAASVLAVGGELNAVINNIAEMGFPREAVERALRAAYNNPDRAVEFLTTGIPDDVQPPPATAVAGTTTSGAGSAPPNTTTVPGPTPTAAPVGGHPPPQSAESLNPTDMQQMLQQIIQQHTQQPAGSPLVQALQNIPQFDQLRVLIQNKPEMLHTVLASLRTQNPHLFQLINDNQQEFIGLLKSGLPQHPGAPGGMPPGMAQLLGQVPPPQQSGVLQVTQDEKAAIDRLTSLGFSQRAAAEAYFSCEKNEEMAANYLLENGMEMDFDAPGGGGGDAAPPGEGDVPVNMDTPSDAPQ